MSPVLQTPIFRRTARPYSVLRSGGKYARPVVVGLLPGDLLEFHELRRRARYTLAIDDAFRIAVRAAAAAARRERNGNGGR